MDGERDDRRLAGSGVAADLGSENGGRDATDCRQGVENGPLTLREEGAALGATRCEPIDFGGGGGEWPDDSECDDPRFEGRAVGAFVAGAERGASDCRRPRGLGASALRDSPSRRGLRGHPRADAVPTASDARAPRPGRPARDGRGPRRPPGPSITDATPPEPGSVASPPAPAGTAAFGVASPRRPARPCARCPRLGARTRCPPADPCRRRPPRPRPRLRPSRRGSRAPRPPPPRAG